MRFKTGGQGSVYKAKRMGEILTVVKVIPTPFLVNKARISYLDFRNEVLKLQRVIEKPNPHVVPILNHGLTSTGSIPFIEMEFIDGPDLEELLKPPHDPIFPYAKLLK